MVSRIILGPKGGGEGRFRRAILLHAEARVAFAAFAARQMTTNGEIFVVVTLLK